MNFEFMRPHLVLLCFLLERDETLKNQQQRIVDLQALSLSLNEEVIVILALFQKKKKSNCNITYILNFLTTKYIAMYF